MPLRGPPSFAAGDGAVTEKYFHAGPRPGVTMGPLAPKDVHTGTRMPLSEEQLRSLMIAGLAGDGAAHGRLLRALVPVLRGWFRRRMGQDDTIEDLMQEVLIAVHNKRATYDPARPFGGWLFAVARYKMIDHFRRQGRECPLGELEDLLPAAETADSGDARADVESLLATISPKQAAAIRATHLDGLSVAEAAEKQGLSPSDIKVSVHRGLKALAARIGRIAP
jgi:RNA polymerase sigma factor (sigma-70 family)